MNAKEILDELVDMMVKGVLLSFMVVAWTIKKSTEFLMGKEDEE